MALPDPHAGEPTVELPPGLWDEYRTAVASVAGWEAHAKALRERIEAIIGDAHAATVNGDTVITYRPTSRVAAARLLAEYPDLVQHFMVTQTTETLDVKAFEARHPDIVAQYRSRQFRVADKGIQT